MGTKIIPLTRYKPAGKKPEQKYIMGVISTNISAFSQSHLEGISRLYLVGGTELLVSESVSEIARMIENEDKGRG